MPHWYQDMERINAQICDHEIIRDVKAKNYGLLLIVIFISYI